MLSECLFFRALPTTYRSDAPTDLHLRPTNHVAMAWAALKGLPACLPIYYLCIRATYTVIGARMSH